MARRFLLTTRGPVALRPRIFHRFTTFSAMVLRRFACTMIASRWTRERARLERAPWKETSSWASKLTERGLKKGERERERERCRERAEERQRDQRGKEVARLSEVWVEGKSLTWSPKRSSLSFLGEFTSQFLVVLRLCHLCAWTPFLTRN